MTIPTFRRSAAPIVTREKPRDRKREKFRGSRHERGYDAAWTKLAAEYRASVKGQCEECRRRGYLTLADVVDHMIPVVDAPDRRLDWTNLDAQCHAHHNGLKRRVEDYARKTNALEMLPIWMKHPETRPIAFQILKFGPLKGLINGEEHEKEG